MPAPPPRANRRVEPNRLAAFLNIPYDNEFQDLYLAYIAGLSAYGLRPRATLELPGGARRLERILELVGDCYYSIHDLSRVELDLNEPPTPRLNMAFELGLAVAWDWLHPQQHLWFVYETRDRRALKSLSDLAGTDVYIHDGTPQGVFRELGNALVRTTASQPTMRDMEVVFARLRRTLPTIMRRTGARSVFEARVFQELVLAAGSLANLRLK